MSQKHEKSGAHVSDKEKRLAEALRANLRRRKDQMRARSKGDGAADTQPDVDRKAD